MNKLIRNKELQDKFSISRSTLYELRKDSTFPKPISLGKRAVGFFEHEIDAWLKERAEERSQ